MLLSTIVPQGYLIGVNVRIIRHDFLRYQITSHTVSLNAGYVLQGRRQESA